MPGPPVAPTPEAWETLRRTVHSLKLATSNLRNRLTTFGVRQQRAVWMPPQPVHFRNDSGEEVPAHGVMYVTGSVTVGPKEYVTIEKPDTSLQRLCLVNGKRPVADGNYGRGTWLSEADWVLYDSGTPAYGESWGPKQSQWSLTKWRYGFTIIGNPDSEALKVRALQMPVNSFLCKFNEEITADGDTGPVSVYDGNQADTSIDVTGCVNRTGLDCDSATWGKAVWLGGNWFVEPYECPA